MLRLNDSEIESIDPISYSIIFDARPHKRDWHIEFQGDKQVTLSDGAEKRLSFDSEREATLYCLSRWPTLRKI